MGIDYTGFETLKVDIANKAGWLTIDHPPINLFDAALIGEMAAAGEAMAADESVSAVVIQSADADFFIAHADVTLIQTIAGLDPVEDPERSMFHAMTEVFRTMPKPTIGKIDGIARGGGLEFLAALDMRFCSLENTVLSQPEVTIGVTPGGGGMARWPQIIGYGRAMELMLCGQDFDGATAERYGMVNRAMPSADLGAFVDAAARRMAQFPSHAVALIKQVGQNEGTLEERLGAENCAFMKSARHPDAVSAMKKFMASGGQQREDEIAGAFS